VQGARGRAAERSTGDLLAALKDLYMAVATAKVAGSALEARQMGYLRGGDVVIMNSEELLYVAKEQALALAALRLSPAAARGAFRRCRPRRRRLDQNAAGEPPRRALHQPL